MSHYTDVNDVDKKLDLQHGFNVVLLDRLAKENIYGSLECARNIFLVDRSKKIVWQIQTDFDANGGSFTNIFADEDGVKGYRWDGGTYEINLESGKGVPVAMLK